MPNFEKDFIKNLTEILESEGAEKVMINFYNNTVDRVPPKQAKELSIQTLKNDCFDIWETVKLPKKKLVTPEYILTKLNNDKVYQSFAPKFKKLLDKTDLKNSFSLYPTTYGIGLHNLFNRNKIEIQTKVEKLLNELGIKYSTEYSEAHWVFRFKISKSAENIERIKQM